MKSSYIVFDEQYFIIIIIIIIIILYNYCLLSYTDVKHGLLH